MNIALEPKTQPIWTPNFIEAAGSKSSWHTAATLAINSSGTFITVRHGTVSPGERWQFEDLTATGADVTFQILAGLLAGEMVTAHPYLTGASLAQPTISPRNQQALALLADWLSEPDDLGSEWWASFEDELADNRLSFRSES